MIAPYTAGWASWGMTRCAMNGPWQDEPHFPNCRAIWQQLGSAHTGGMNCVLADGSVKTYSYGLSISILQALVRKNDGLVVDLSSL
jgi:prepilin-type processing-associated H-X9-DG protein